MPRRTRSAAHRRHSVLELAPGLLLAFKPAGHTEDQHRHPYSHTLTVLEGCLQVRFARDVVVLRRESPRLRIVAGRPHATVALADTWVAVRARRRPTS